MKGDILYQKVVITNNVEEINEILKDGTFRVQSITPVPITGSVEFDGANGNGNLGGSTLCYLLAKVDWEI